MGILVADHVDMVDVGGRLHRMGRICLKIVLALLLAVAVTHLIAPDFVPRLLGRPEIREWRIPRDASEPALASVSPLDRHSSARSTVLLPAGDRSRT
jgi:hypothetical protein